MNTTYPAVLEEKYNRYLKSKVWNELSIDVSLFTNKQKESIQECILLRDLQLITKSIFLKRLPHLILYDVTSDYAKRLIDINQYFKNNGTALTNELMVLCYGTEEGNRRWQSYKDKQSKTNTFEYKNNKYGMTKEEFDAFNKTRAVTLENQIRLHGEKEGKRRFDLYRERQGYTNTLEYFLEKYGEERGLKKWKRANQKKGHTLENYRERYGDEAETKLKEFFNNTPSFYSKISQDFCKRLDSQIHEGKTYYAEKDGEFAIPHRDGCYMCDFVILCGDVKICIEFNGDYYHANPLTYAPDDNMVFGGKNKKAKNKWKEDRKKHQVIMDNGFDVVVVWELSYMKNKESVINGCVDYIRTKIDANRK